MCSSLADDGVCIAGFVILVIIDFFFDFFWRQRCRFVLEQETYTHTLRNQIPFDIYPTIFHMMYLRHQESRNCDVVFGFH